MSETATVIPFTPSRQQREDRLYAEICAAERRLDECLARIADMLKRNPRTFDSSTWTGR